MTETKTESASKRMTKKRQDEIRRAYKHFNAIAKLLGGNVATASLWMLHEYLMRIDCKKATVECSEMGIKLLTENGEQVVVGAVQKEAPKESH